MSSPHHDRAACVQQRSQHHAVDDGEDRRRRANAESEREDRRRGESAVVRERAQCIARVAREVFQHAHAARVPTFLLAALHTAHRPQRRRPGLLEGHARRHMHVDLPLEVIAQLLIELCLHLAATKERTQP